MIGTPSGAMIMAPMTVAVEFPSTPATAMTPESVNIVQNADTFEARSPWTRSRWSRRSPRSQRCDAGRTLSDTLLMARASSSGQRRDALAMRSTPKTRNSTTITASLCTTSQPFAESSGVFARSPPTR
jgi:hypothetical protein